ncbi:MAG: hypothetical protein ACO21G_00620, partial [Algoriphagus sp.]
MKRILFFQICCFLLFNLLPQEAFLQQSKFSRMAFGSCNRQDSPQPLWKPIAADHPDLWVWMGDNIYGDSRIMDTLRAKYARQNANPDYQVLKASTPLIGIWYDHD